MRGRLFMIITEHSFARENHGKYTQQFLLLFIIGKELEEKMQQTLEQNYLFSQNKNKGAFKNYHLVERDRYLEHCGTYFYYH